MTQTEKDLLLKDLCARLPYDVKVRRYVYTTLVDSIQSVELLDLGWLEELYAEEAEFKPYLFPLSSMTEEQKKEESSFDPFKTDKVKTLGDWAVCLVDFYNKYHFDYRGLIEKGLAIDATELNIYK
jgi:hypothetical protein